MIDLYRQQQYTTKLVENRHKTDRNPFVFLLIVVLAFSTMSHVQPTKKAYPKTWKCKSCGYENYDGIKACAVCGKDR